MNHRQHLCLLVKKEVRKIFEVMKTKNWSPGNKAGDRERLGRASAWLLMPGFLALARLRQEFKIPWQPEPHSELQISLHCIVRFHLKKLHSEENKTATRRLPVSWSECFPDWTFQQQSVWDTVVRGETINYSRLSWGHSRLTAQVQNLSRGRVRSPKGEVVGSREANRNEVTCDLE